LCVCNHTVILRKVPKTRIRLTVPLSMSTFQDKSKLSQSPIVNVHPPIHRSIGSTPVGTQCPLTSSLHVGEFLGYRDWLWYPRLSPVLVSIALPFAFHISVFSIHSSSPAIGFHSSIFYGGGICTPPPTLLLIPDFGLALW